MTLKGQTVKLYTKTGCREISIVDDRNGEYLCRDQEGNSFKASKQIYDKMFFHKKQQIKTAGFKGENPRLAHRIYSKTTK